MDCSKVSLKKGNKNNQVKELQQYLKYLGLYTAEVDGDYGSLTESAVKKLQKNYGLVVDGWFGTKTCKACGINGADISTTIHQIPKDVWKDMMARFDKYVKDNKKEPKIMYLNFENKYRYVTLEKFKEIKTRWDKWLKEHDNTEPNFMYINKPAEGSSNASTGIIAKMKDAIGNFTSFKEAYNLLIGRGYGAYNNDIYTQDQAIKRLKNRQGINCSDSCQLMYALAVAMGLQARYVHIICKSGAGHIVLDVKYPYGASTWTRIDPAAALSTSSRYSWGNIWCSGGRVIGYNDGWLMSDDGIT